MPKAIHLTPRGVVTDDFELFKELKSFFEELGIKYTEHYDGIWYKCYVSGIKGGDLIVLMRLFAERVGGVDVWLLMSKIYSSTNKSKNKEV